jgi:hypothetical protein
LNFITQKKCETGKCCYFGYHSAASVRSLHSMGAPLLAEL